MTTDEEFKEILRNCAEIERQKERRIERDREDVWKMISDLCSTIEKLTDRVKRLEKRKH